MVYTIHPAEVAENSQLTSGPHVVEVVASGVQLQWSQMLQLDLIWQLSQVYSSYTYSPWVSPYREVKSRPIMLKCCELFAARMMRLVINHSCSFLCCLACLHNICNN